MLPDRVSNTGPLTYESGALPIALRGPAQGYVPFFINAHLKKIRFVGTQLQADISLHCAQMSRFSRHQIFSILFRFTYI